MYWSRNKKNRYTPAYPTQFCYIKVGFKGVHISRTCFADDNQGADTNQQPQDIKRVRLDNYRRKSLIDVAVRLLTRGCGFDLELFSPLLERYFQLRSGHLMALAVGET